MLIVLRFPHTISTLFSDKYRAHYKFSKLRGKVASKMCTEQYNPIGKAISFVYKYSIWTASGYFSVMEAKAYVPTT